MCAERAGLRGAGRVARRGSQSSFLADVVEQDGAATVEDAIDLFESIRTTVVRVGHVGADVFAVKVAHQQDVCLVFGARVYGLQLLDFTVHRAIHREDVVKLLKVPVRNGARGGREGDPVLLRGLPHAVVCELSLVM